MLAGKFARSHVDLPVLRAPHRNADWPAGSVKLRRRANSVIQDLSPKKFNYIGVYSEIVLLQITPFTSAASKDRERQGDGVRKYASIEQRSQIGVNLLSFLIGGNTLFRP